MTQPTPTTAARVVSVNVAVPREAGWTTVGRTAIDKRPVAGPVRVGALGLAGDHQANRRHHGGPDQAVYAFASEDLAWWGRRLGRPVEPGLFGENLTTAGIDVNAAEIGERWRIGTALLEVRSVRTPCAVFKAWLGRSGYDDRAWARRFTEAARPGPYLRVLEEGELAAGDAIDVVHRPGHGVTVTTFFRAVHGDPVCLPRLADVPDLLPKARAKLDRYLAEHAAAVADGVPTSLF